MQKWEYYIVVDADVHRSYGEKYNRELGEYFNAIGSQGWELVAITVGGAYFKRPLPDCIDGGKPGEPTTNP